MKSTGPIVFQQPARPDSANLIALFGLAAEMGLLHLLLPEAGNLSPSQSKNADGQVKTHTKFVSVCEGADKETSPAAELTFLTDL